MDAFLITLAVVGLLAGVFLWAVHTVNIGARWRQRELEQYRRQADASWARMLELLHIESAERWRDVDRTKLRRVK